MKKSTITKSNTISKFSPQKTIVSFNTNASIHSQNHSKTQFKNLKMHFCNSSTLLISAPKHITKKECLRFLEENRQWIDTQYHSLQKNTISIYHAINFLFLGNGKIFQILIFNPYGNILLSRFHQTH